MKLQFHYGIWCIFRVVADAEVDVMFIMHAEA